MFFVVIGVIKTPVPIETRTKFRFTPVRSAMSFQPVAERRKKRIILPVESKIPNWSEDPAELPAMMPDAVALV